MGVIGFFKWRQIIDLKYLPLLPRATPGPALNQLYNQTLLYWASHQALINGNKTTYPHLSFIIRIWTLFPLSAMTHMWVVAKSFDLILQSDTQKNSSFLKHIFGAAQWPQLWTTLLIFKKMYPADTDLRQFLRIPFSVFL